MIRNRDLFWNLLEPEHQRARAYCRKLLGNRDDGDDLYHDALVRALAGIESLASHDSFRPWLYRVIINCYKNRFRRPWWQKLVSLEGDSYPELISHQSETDFKVRRHLDIALNGLSPSDRALVILHELQGWPIAETAHAAGLTAGNTRVRLSRARGKMRRTLVKHFKRSARFNLIPLKGDLKPLEEN